MQNLFSPITQKEHPTLYKMFEKISDDEKSRIELKISYLKNNKKIAQELETTLESQTIDFLLPTKIFEKKYLMLLNPVLKPKLNTLEQIEKLESKGIAFTLMNRVDAKDFLTNNTFYFKLTAYRKNYVKDKHDKYIGLDFAYLVDLSVVDMHISNESLKVCACIEHALKTKLLRDFENTPENGYNIINDFLDERISYSMSQDRVNELRYKSLWQIVENITLGELFDLCDFFYKRNTRENLGFNKIKNLSSCIKKLRNSVSHNSCLINDLCSAHIANPTYELVDYLYETCFKRKYPKKHIIHMLKNRFIHNFLGTLLALSYISKSKKINYYRYRDFLSLTKRITKNQEYYKENKTLTLTYKFIKKVIIHLYKINQK